jgi:hypothetical protein
VLFVPSYHHELLKKHSPLKGRYRKKIGQVCCRVSVEPKRVWANTIEQMGRCRLKERKVKQSVEVEGTMEMKAIKR